MSRIVIAGSYDTKAEPLKRLAADLAAGGHPPITIDTSVFAAEHGCDYGATVVAAVGGRKSADLPALGRAAAVNVMAAGGEKILHDLFEKGEVSALVCMGGSNAATIFSKLSRALPIGVPKILMATTVAGETRPIVNASDVILLYPVVDIEGDNSVLRGMISRLASVAISASKSSGFKAQGGGASAVALTMFGVTTPCVSKCRALLAREGIESFVFHANGSGGRSFEQFIAQSLVSSVIDVTITELADELFGGTLPAGPDRLRTAAKLGLSQVIAPGAIDMINFGALDTVPAQYKSRRIVAHNDLVTLVRTTPDENRLIAESVAERLGVPTAPTVVMVPKRGFSALDKGGSAFFDPQATQAFVDGLRASLPPIVPVIEVDRHINDPEFADALVAESLRGRAKTMLEAGSA